MKKLIILILVATTSVAVGQNTYSYGYDAAGNRISRTINMQKMSNPENDTTENYEILYSEIENNFYENELLVNNENSDEIDEIVKKQLILEGKQLGISVYPNPVTEVLNLRIDGLEGKEGYFVVTEINGREIIKRKIRSSESIIDFSQTPIGTYLLIIHVGDKKEEFKIVRMY